MRILASFKKFMALQARAGISRYMVMSFLTGIFLFGVESSFIYVLQGFLSSIGLVSDDKLNLPAWYPTGAALAVTALVLFGLLRALALTLKDYFSTTANELFVKFYRQEVMRISLFFPNLSSSQELIHIYNVASLGGGNLAQQVSQLLIAVVSGTLLFVLGFVLAPLEMALSLLCLLVLLSPLFLLGSRIQYFGKRMNEESRAVSDIFLMGVKNHFLLRMYSRIDGEFEKARGALDRFQYLVRRYLAVVAFKRSYPLFAGTLVISAVTWVSVTWLGTSGVSLLAFFYIFIRFSQTVSEAAGTLALVFYSEDSLNRLQRWYDHILAAGPGARSPLVTEPPLDGRVLGRLRAERLRLRLEDVFFQYEGGRTIIDGLSLELASGDVLAVHGPSGAGKSTLLHLILGLEAATRGTVRLNGLDCPAIRRELVEVLGYVGPENFLNRGSILDNLLYCHPSPESVTPDEIEAALKLAAAWELVAAFPRGLQEELNETAQISSGQKQRLAIARAMLRRPRILILDEATANLDEQTESDILDALQPKFPDMITVIISHRHSVDRVAKRTLSFGEGRSTSMKDFQEGRP